VKVAGGDLLQLDTGGCRLNSEASGERELLKYWLQGKCLSPCRFCRSGRLIPAEAGQVSSTGPPDGLHAERASVRSIDRTVWGLLLLKLDFGRLLGFRGEARGSHGLAAGNGYGPSPSTAWSGLPHTGPERTRKLNHAPSHCRP
jgi:hypothetical protein